MTKIQINTAIVSVHDKSSLDLLADYFIKYKIKVFSTGGTAKFLRNYSKKIDLIEISEFTNFNEILGGRVKSLHPNIHSGILADRENIIHQKQLKKINVPFIDLVVVNLYPFEKVINEKASTKEDCIENIDIGGPTLIRGAAKNFNSVTILSHPDQYNYFLEETKKNKNCIPRSFRENCAKIAFENTSYYESIISNWFNKDEDNFCKDRTSLALKKVSELRYGENPHQNASLFQFGENKFTKISGKDLSYNNICDLEIAIELAQQFLSPSCVILKHGNPCGVALNSKQEKAYIKALECDKVSAFGGIIAFNKKLSLETANKINKLFTEVVVAPDFSKESIKLLSLKKNLILVKYTTSAKKTNIHLKTTQSFLLLQNKDNLTVSKKNLTFKTKNKPNNKVLEDMIFAFIVSKYINSNAIVLVKNLATKGIGVGQTSRLDSVQQAIKKMNKNFKIKSVVLASDGFFPFPDIIKLCANNNVNSIIQPGGSKNDDQVIEAANKHNISVVFTGVRHFKH